MQALIAHPGLAQTDSHEGIRELQKLASEFNLPPPTVQQRIRSLHTLYNAELVKEADHNFPTASERQAGAASAGPFQSDWPHFHLGKQVIPWNSQAPVPAEVPFPTVAGPPLEPPPAGGGAPAGMGAAARAPARASAAAPPNLALRPIGVIPALGPSTTPLTPAPAPARAEAPPMRRPGAPPLPGHVCRCVLPHSTPAALPRTTAPESASSRIRTWAPAWIPPRVAMIWRPMVATCRSPCARLGDG